MASDAREADAATAERDHVRGELAAFDWAAAVAPGAEGVAP